MSKRKYDQIRESDENIKKNSLDSDEEESEDDDNVMDENDIEGEEEGEARQEDEIRMTAFNMKEELEEGHFDKNGHFQWNKEKEIRDSWLDNIDWHKIKTDLTKLKKAEDDGSSEDEAALREPYDPIPAYQALLEYLKPGETVAKALRRLGGQKKLSSVERLKLKKSGQLNKDETVEKITELANEILNKTGNMDVYQESYEQISNKIKQKEARNKAPPAKEAELDMYADDFDQKEKAKLTDDTTEKKVTFDTTSAGASKDHSGEGDASCSASGSGTSEASQMWEFKWTQEDSAEVHGPVSSEQMQQWVEEGYFKDGVWVRKYSASDGGGDRVGVDSKFYSSSRIDFELYIS